MENNRIDVGEELLDRLTSVASRVDAVPSEVVEAAIGCFEWRTLDSELAELLFDSERGCDQLIGVRAEAIPRQLTFEARHLMIELEVGVDSRPQLVGQLVPPGPAAIEIRSPGASMAVRADEFGRFWADRISGGVLSLHITPDDRTRRPADTAWVPITPAAQELGCLQVP